MKPTKSVQPALKTCGGNSPRSVREEHCRGRRARRGPENHGISSARELPAEDVWTRDCGMDIDSKGGIDNDDDCPDDDDRADNEVADCDDDDNDITLVGPTGTSGGWVILCEK